MEKRRGKGNWSWKGKGGGEQQKERKGGIKKMTKLTPIFNSITPQSTSNVEFPVLTIVLICTILKTEHTVVTNPNKKTPTSTTFFLTPILNPTSSGMGKKKITTSKKMVTAARP